MGMLPRQFKALVEMLQAELGAIKEAIQQQTAAECHANEAESVKWTEVPGIIAAAINAHQDSERSRADREQTHGEQQALISSQDRTARWTRNACIAAALYGIVAAWQAYLMRRTYTEIQKQTPFIGQSATAASSSASTADAEFKVSSRAWMTATLSNPGGVEDGRPLLVIITFANTGKTPALNVWTCQVAKLARNPSPKLDINCPSSRRSPGTQVILANSNTLRVANAIGDDNTPRISTDGLLTPTIHEDLRKRGHIAITYGYIEYDDVFRIHHWTKFCSYLVIMPSAPGGLPETNNWSECDVGNDVDSNSE